MTAVYYTLLNERPEWRGVSDATKSALLLGDGSGQSRKWPSLDNMIPSSSTSSSSSSSSDQVPSLTRFISFLLYCPQQHGWPSEQKFSDMEAQKINPYGQWRNFIHNRRRSNCYDCSIRATAASLIHDSVFIVSPALLPRLYFTLLLSLLLVIRLYYFIYFAIKDTRR
jgi:hypothetical protein